MLGSRQGRSLGEPGGGSSAQNEATRRLIDLALAGFWLILLAPLMLAIAVLIWLDSPGPVLYVPLMIGLNGRPFRLYRFRNMYADWRARSPSERRPPVGRFIRNYSLDHLPILINLLRGDLTLVGPRAQEAEVVDLADPIWQRYLSVKPGLLNYSVLKMGKTYGHSWEDNMAVKQALELEYIAKRTLGFDLWVVSAGLRALVISRGNIKARLGPSLADREDHEQDIGKARGNETGTGITQDGG